MVPSPYQVPYLKLYGDYCLNYNANIEILHEIEDDKKYMSFFQVFILLDIIYLDGDNQCKDYDYTQ